MEPRGGAGQNKYSSTKEINMEELKTLWTKVIACIRAINDKAQDGHLNARGATFYSEHMVFAKVQEGIDDGDADLTEIPDMIFEIFFGGRGLNYPSSNEVVALELSALEEATASPMENGRQVRQLLEAVIMDLEQIANNDSTSQGESDLVGNLSRQMQHRLYFINSYLD